MAFSITAAMMQQDKCLSPMVLFVTLLSVAHASQNDLTWAPRGKVLVMAYLRIKLLCVRGFLPVILFYI